MSRTMKRAALAVALTGVLIFGAKQGDAYCRTRTVLPSESYDPATGCWNEGHAVYHPSQCLTYAFARSNGTKLAPQDLAEAFETAFETWGAPSAYCNPGISAVEVAPRTSSNRVEYNMNAANDNLIIVHEDQWPHPSSFNSLALTTLVYNEETGAILDADMEINATPSMAITTQDPVPSQAYDLATIALHETGHMLGLSHTERADAAMNAVYLEGSTRRQVTTDDQQGICSIYPTRTQRTTQLGTGAIETIAATACALTPSGAGSCDVNMKHGCAAAPIAVGSASERLTAMGLGLGFMALIAARRLRRQADRRS